MIRFFVTKKSHINFIPLCSLLRGLKSIPAEKKLNSKANNQLPEVKKNLLFSGTWIKIFFQSFIYNSIFYLEIIRLLDIIIRKSKFRKSLSEVSIIL